MYFLYFPLESELIGKPGAYHRPDAPPAWKIYRHMAETVGLRRAVTKACPEVGITEHPFDARRRLVILVNYSPAPVMMPLTLRSPWKTGKQYYGHPLKQNGVARICRLDANDAAVFEIKR